MGVDIGVERASSRMSSHMSARIEVVAGRRRWTVEQKLSMLREFRGQGIPGTVYLIRVGLRQAQPERVLRWGLVSVYG